MSETPIYDALVLERAMDDQEGRGLVEAIHERQRQRLLSEVRAEAHVAASIQRPLKLAVMSPFGLLR